MVNLHPATTATATSAFTPPPPCDAGAPHAHEHLPLSYVSHAFNTIHGAKKTNHTQTHTHSPACSKSYFEKERGVWRREAEPHRWEPVHRSHQGRGAQRKRVCLNAKKKSDERDVFPRAPLCHQINFTLSHLAAAVMSFIHPLPRSHGNPAAWSRSFFYICLRSTSLPPFSRCRRT